MSNELMSMVLWFAVFFGIVYFIIIRPNKKQQEKRRNMLNNIQVKDKVVTIGGLHGTVTKIKEDTVLLKVTNNVELEFLKAAIQTIQSSERNEKEEPTEEAAKINGELE